MKRQEVAVGEDLVGLDLGLVVRLREAEVEVVAVVRPTHGDVAGVELDEGAAAVLGVDGAVTVTEGLGRLDAHQPPVGEAVVEALLLLLLLLRGLHVSCEEEGYDCATQRRTEGV